jgi:hypothetical protein
MKNNKKHTILKKRLKICSVLFPIFLLFGCSKDITPPVVIPIAPVKIESVVPQFNKISVGIDSTIKSNLKIENKIKDQHKELSIQQLAILEAIAQADKFKEILLVNKCISEIDSINFINNLRSIETRNLFIEKQNIELEELRKEQSEILKMTKEDASITYRKLLDKEQEANSLREQNDYLGKNLIVKSNEVVQLQKDLEKEKIKSAKATVYKNWVIGLVTIFILWLIIKNVLMVYFPMTKFRI